MTQKNKELLLKDLCARLPYGVKFASFSESMKNHSEPTTLRQIYYNNDCDANNIQGDDEDNISTIIELMKPYLRQMSNMTEEEKEEIKEITENSFHVTNDCSIVSNDWRDGAVFTSHYDAFKIVDWLNKHHFDYRGLIEKGLALEAPEGTYK